MMNNKKTNNLSVVFTENKIGQRNKGRNSYVSSAIMKGSNNSSVTNLKQEFTQINKPYFPVGRKNFSYSPLIKKMINKDQNKSGYNNSLVYLQHDNNSKEKKPSFPNFRVSYEKDLKEKLQSRNNSYKYSFNNIVTSSSFDKYHFFNDSKVQSKYPSQSISFNNNNLHTQNKFMDKPLNTEFMKIEEKPNETSLYNDEIKNGITKTDSNKILNFERDCESLFKKLESKNDFNLICTMYKEIYGNAMKELPELKNYNFLNKILDGYAQITDSLITQNKLMQPSFYDFEKFYSKYESLHQKYTEARRELDYREKEIKRLKDLLDYKVCENGKEVCGVEVESGSHILTDQAYLNDENYVFNKKIKYLNQNNVDDLDAMYFPDRVVQKTRSFSEDKAKVPKLNFQIIHSKYVLNHSNNANGGLPKNIKIHNAENNNINECKPSINVGGRSNIIKIQSKW